MNIDEIVVDRVAAALTEGRTLSFEPRPSTISEAAEEMEYDSEKILDSVRKRWISSYAEEMIVINRKKLDLSNRQYLRAVYDVRKKYPVGSRNILIMAGRQVEKTVQVNAFVSLENGRLIEAGTVRVGDDLATMSNDGASMTSGKVTWVSRRYSKPCLKVKTRQGHEVIIATTHPMRLWSRWVPGGELKVGDRLAAVRQCGSFNRIPMPDERIRLTAYMIGDGHIGDAQYSFTSVPGPKLNEFLADIHSIGGSYRIHQKKKKTPALGIHLRQAGPLRDWMKQDGLHDTRSATKFIPDWVFDLDRRQTSLFLNRLWSTDGHVKRNGQSKYSIEYCSISLRLAKDVQAILWKFGIPSKIRENWPNIFKRRGERRFAYILRIETQEGIRCFLEKIGALGKSEGIKPPSTLSNNNRDTFPKEINSLIKGILSSRDGRIRMGRADKRSPYSRGLKVTLKYPPTKDRLELYLAFFRSDKRYDQRLVDILERHVYSDLFWDEITEITPVGVQECIDFEVEGTHNFVAEGLVTHNSSSLASKAITLSIIYPTFFTLAIEPRHDQVALFSQQRFRPMCEDSEVVTQGFRSRANVWQVGSREFANGSLINFRSCYYSADPSRGITANHLLIDEIQDIISDNIPILEESMSHFQGEPDKTFRTYAGTPKTTSNTLNRRYKETCQFEWLVKCGSGHENYLDDKVIGKKGYICTKCGGPIDMRNGKWHPLRPSMLDSWWGIRIPQLMVPFTTHAKILAKMEDPNIPRKVFFNEVLGLPYDEGELVLTEADVFKRCEERDPVTPEEGRKLGTQDIFLCAGVDHGTGGYSPTGMSEMGERRTKKGVGPSFTVVAMGAYFPDGRFRIVKIIRFVGELANLARQPEIINQIIREHGVQWIMSDYGFGVHTNARLVADHGWSRLGDYPLLLEAEYVASHSPYTFHQQAFRYMIDRNTAIEKTIDGIKRGIITFFRQDEMKRFIDDFTSIYVEYSHTTNRIKYDHTLPDDAFHAVLYCYHAALQRKGRLVSTSLPSI